MKLYLASVERKLLIINNRQTREMNVTLEDADFSMDKFRSIVSQLKEELLVNTDQ